MRTLAARTVFVAAMAVSSASAAGEGVPRELQKDVACMARVVEAMPGVDHVATGAEMGADQDVVSEGLPPPAENAWLQPYIQYRVKDHGERSTIRFMAQRNRKRHADGAGYDYSFSTVLSGLSSTASPGPSDWGTPRVSQAWKRRCDVDAIAIFE
ncbi:MAG TPA: hypothetical protein VGG48_05200 [Rhizomicrobium sp.]|jgi:hypothetical protein